MNSQSVLYVGSGKSALDVSKYASAHLTRCCVNNAWRLFTPTNPCNVWIFAGDFLEEQKPPQPCYQQKISHEEYERTSVAVCGFMGYQGKFPQHHLGYTIFFQGLYWILWNIRPASIYTLGFDHDYSPDKVKKWLENQCPGPQNQYCGKKNNKPLEEWAAGFFASSPTDAFYGHGTPDPMRLGATEIGVFFSRSIEYAQRLGCQLYNASTVMDGLNSYPHQLPP